jgi:hypothetical protein
MKKKIILQDPTSFTVYDLKINGVQRRIVLIGEIHDIVGCSNMPTDEKTTDYMLLSDFIEQYHRSIGNDKVLDIFSESFYIGKKKLGWLPTLHYLVYLTTHMDDARALSYIRTRLGPCSPKFNFSIYECPENLRVHLCDVRFVKEMEYSIKRENEKECFVDKLFKIGLSYIHPEKIPRANYALTHLVSFVKKFLFEKNSPEYHTKLSEFIIAETKIYKQLKHIPSNVVRRKMTKWSHQAYDNYITDARKKFIHFEKMYGKEMKDLTSVEYVSENCSHAFIRNISLPTLYIISVFMDLYLSSRLLRRFSDSTYAENSIIYVGEFHAKQYRNLMKLLGAKQVFHKSSIRDMGYTSCVDISSFYYSYMVPKKK